MNDYFSKTCLALIVGLLAVIAFKPREKEDAPKSPPAPGQIGGHLTGGRLPS